MIVGVGLHVKQRSESVQEKSLMHFFAGELIHPAVCVLPQHYSFVNSGLDGGVIGVVQITGPHVPKSDCWEELLKQYRGIPPLGAAIDFSQLFVHWPETRAKSGQGACHILLQEDTSYQVALII